VSFIRNGRVCGLLILGTIQCVSLSVLGDRNSNWRMFKAADGLPETYCGAVTVSPRGNVWVKHGDAGQISVYDGYKIQTLPSPGHDNYRVYESRTGQLWSLYASGLAVYAAGQWVYHPVPEIRAQIQADFRRQVRQLPLLPAERDRVLIFGQMRQIPLLPAERDRVLFLLPDKLMEYDSANRTATILKLASETGLGKFMEMTEARDGGVWVTGQKGVARFPGPLRHLRAGAACQEFLLDDSWHVENLRRPFESSQGALTMAASDSRGGDHVILSLDEGRWRVRRVPEANIRQAWPGWDETTWACTPNSLLRFDPPPASSFGREKLWAGQYKDVATETNDVFWLATSEGLLRYAPYIWRTPVALEDLNSHVHAIVADGKTGLWVAASDFLLRFQEGRARMVKWPEGIEGSFDSRDALYNLPQGQLAVTAGDRAFLFDPVTEGFQPVAHPSGQPARILGQFPDGTLVAQVLPPETDANTGFELDRFNGRTFQPFLRSPTNWVFGPELFFVAPQASGDVWAGGNGGLGRFRNGAWDLFGAAQGFRDSRALCLADLGGGKLWCGGTTRVFEFNGKIWSVLASGFDRINAIVKGPDETTWVATANGLFTYVNGSWVEQGIEEGLPSIGVSALFLDHNRRFWAGTTRGLSRYHPDADPFPPKTLPPMLESAKNGRVGEENVTVLLNGIDKWQQTPGSRLLFATRLDESPWTAFTNSMVKTFARLGAGKHRLEIKAMDRNRNEDPDPVALDFSVVLAWYKDPRLIGSVVSGAVLVIFFAGLAVNRHLRLIRSYAEVERVVAIRTRELERANEELLQSQKMKALGTMAAGIAHDFNNILSIIRGSAQIIQSNLEDKQKILTRLTRIQAVVEQGSGIVRSILGLSRVKEKDVVKADLNAMVENAVRWLGDRFLPDVTVRFEPAPDLPPVLAASELIQQMLLNLLLNAADAMDHHGEIILTTGRLRELPPGMALSPAPAAGYVQASVRDTGCGIAPDILPRIFEPFFTTKALSVQRGTGLGLSIVYEVARQLGYGLQVRSDPGQGSTFTIVLPVRETPWR
jgi:signal transduction histidine kinase/ligand-binding sensor domain-containing protein